jgi:hypothetical protein
VKLRRTWTSSAPGGAPVPPGAPGIEGVAIHWPGTPRHSYWSTESKMASSFVSIRNYHMMQGSSDIQYNLAVTRFGVYELRGLANRSGANGSTGANKTNYSVLVLVGINDSPSEVEMLDPHIREALRLCNAYAGRNLAVRTHNDVRPTPTACPGELLTAWVRSLDAPPILPPPVQPPVQTPSSYQVIGTVVDHRVGDGYAMQFTDTGHFYTWGYKSRFLGAPAGQSYWLDNPNRKGARIASVQIGPDGVVTGYVLVSNMGETYVY